MPIGSRSFRTTTSTPSPRPPSAPTTSARRARRRLLEPHQSLQPDGAGLHVRVEDRPRRDHRREQPVPRPREGQGPVRRVPENTVNPEADYGDQSGLYKLQKDAVARGVKHLFIVWFDGLDWDTTRAAAIAKTGEVYDEGKGHGLIFQDADPDGTAQYGYVVTSPTFDGPADADLDLNAQTVGDHSSKLGGGYDASIAGSTPWKRGPRWADGYLKGQGANADDKAGVKKVGGVLHAYTDSSCSAAEFACGVKSYNNGVNVGDDGKFLPTVFNDLQDQGWKVGTVTSVPFDHASPTAMYAHNVSRDDYQDLAREMLGLESIVQKNGKFRPLPGLDVVIGTGWGQTANAERLRRGQGENAVAGNTYIASDDLKAIDVKNGGKYVVSQRVEGVEGTEALQAAAERAADEGKRLFGFYGTASGHLPYRTTNGDYVPSKGIKGVAEKYQPADLEENPSLADMTRAALTVLSASPRNPSPCSSSAGTPTGACTTTTSTTPSAPFMTARRPSRRSSTGSSGTATGTTRR